MDNYHIPVLLHQSVDGLAINPNGIYVDCTYGGGGHSSEILSRLDKGRLIAFDQDSDAIANKADDHRLTLIQGNFKFMQNYLRYEGITQVDGILADLGVSSHHFDAEQRGFSFRFDAELDMRMNQESELTAKKVINEYQVHELKKMFRTYGEINNVGRLVSAIDTARATASINTINEFKEVIEPITPQKMQAKYLAKVFQAIRIEVNQEMEVLQEMLYHSVNVLKPGGRLSVITYHSLEDRLVKNFIKNGQFEGQPEKDLYGNVDVPLTAVNRKIIIPDEAEIERNNRARSAKLRIAVRN